MSDHAKTSDCPCAQCCFWRKASAEVGVIGSKLFEAITEVTAAASSVNEAAKAWKARAGK